MTTAIFDPLVKCSICNYELHDPLNLPCTHSFCKKCIIQNISETENKIACTICKKSHFIPKNDSEKLLKKSFLSDFLVNFINKNHFDNLKISDEEKLEDKGMCITILSYDKTGNF
jgi:hypothetical protein